MLTHVWPVLKVWRKVSLGSVDFVFSFRRRPRQSSGTEVLRRSRSFESVVPDTPSPAFVLPQEEYLRSEELPNKGLAVIVGAGPGLGHALARRLAREGFQLVLVTRDAAKNIGLAQELNSHGGKVSTIGADATDETSVLDLFSTIESRFGTPSLVIYSLQEFCPANTVEVTVSAFESAWRHNCLGAFLVGRSTARLMSKVGRGTLVFIGSTSSIIGRAGHLNLAVGKFGQRAISQVMARELWPVGVHVAHIMIDADIRESEVQSEPHPQSCPREITESVLMIHHQPRTAWSSELDLRPWNEQFWNHC